MSSESKENNTNEKEPHRFLEDTQTKVELQLGDIIKITHPQNERLNNKDFFIQYIDLEKMLLDDPETGEVVKLKISPDGVVGDGYIQELTILSRSKSASYAVQNGLTTNKWINIYFGGDYPAILTGEITNVENDMIEIRTVDGDTIYINFDYKGIPEDLPIESIEIREPPQPKKKEDEDLDEREQRREQEDVQEFLEDLERERIVAPLEDIPLGSQFTNNVRNQLRELVLRADQVQFGHEELGTIRQLVDVQRERQRYSLEEQLSDLLDDLLSTVPNAKRTQKVLNNIHIMIERFKQLRDEFSAKDDNGLIDGALVFTADYKPLTVYFQRFNHNLYWILPTVKNVKKIYDTYNEEEEGNTDIANLEIDENVRAMMHLIQDYRSNVNSGLEQQNKYVQLYNELNPYFTPFQSPDEENDHIIIEKPVHTNIQVIVDNLEDMDSSVVSRDNIQTRKFVIQKYNTPLTHLITVESQGNKTKTMRTNMFPPDVMSIDSIVTLPEPVVRFSKINLPGTNVLEKANLNLLFFNYWQFLRRQTRVHERPVLLNEEIKYTADNFVNNIKHYTLTTTSEERKEFSQADLYKQFVQTIVPRTRVLFNLMKKYIQGKLSIVDIVGYLEPFLIYTDKITYMQYTDILEFIHEKITEYNLNLEKRSRLFSMLKRQKSESILFPSAYSVLSILETKNNLREEIQSEYDIIDEKLFSNLELLRKIVIKDYGKLYSSALSLQSAPLMFPSEFATLFETEQEKLARQMKAEENKDQCKTRIVAKQYNSMDQLEEDNDKTIYFDRKFDKTNYQLLANYEKDMLRMTPEDFITHLIEELKKKQKLNEDDAEYLAETLIDGHKKVVNGQYAVLYNLLNRENDAEYFVRRANKWVLDKTVDKGINTDDSDILCELQQKCIANPGDAVTPTKCESITVETISLQNQLLKDVVNEFDSKYKMTKEEFEKTVRTKFDYYMKIMAKITSIETSEFLKYSNQKYKLGSSIDQDRSVAPESPYAKLLNLILVQQDFVKKQSDIIRFVNTYTRPPILDGFGPRNQKESEYWLYCIKTNVPILPVFKYDMAHAFVTDPSGYNDFVDRLISKIGKESDDGDSWTALGSGWVIRKADFDIEEGYEEGFRVSTRGALEEDAGNKVVAAIARAVRYDTPESRMISNIVTALSNGMGINLENQKEFILNGVVDTLRETLIPEEEYRRKVKEMGEKGREIPPYNYFYNSTLMHYTLGMFLIAVQTSIPSVKTRKTHPGCVRSFNGYPFEGVGDLSSLSYLACVAYDSRSSSEPWNTLKKKEIIEKKVKQVIDDNLLKLDSVKRKIEEKTDYLLRIPEERIPEEHDVANWLNFLPPLFPFRVKKVMNVSTEFEKSLIHDLRTGSPNQREKILVLDSKVIQFSLLIQEKIQQVIQKKQLLLQNSNHEPYLENACCQTSEQETTIGYFMQNDSGIRECNQIVKKLVNILMDIVSHTKSGLFSSRINTKNMYPPVSQNFDEKTVFLSFIYFCKFNSLLPVPEDLLPLCLEKPEYNFLNGRDSLEEMIRKLKDDGRNYNVESFLRLLQLVGRNNIIHIDLDEPLISSTATLNNLLEAIQDEHEQEQVIEGSLIKKIQGVLDAYEIATSETTPAVRDLNNLLYRDIDSMKEDILDFIDKNRGSKVPARLANKAKAVITNLSLWNIDHEKERKVGQISDDSMYNIVNFYKTFISNFITVFPSIILNKVDFSNVVVQRYMNLSASHSHKISNYIKEYYQDLKVFYGNVKLENVLSSIQKTAKNLERLAQNTPCFTSTRKGDVLLKPIFDERTSKMLFEYYFLRVLIQYMDLTDESDMVVTSVETPEIVQDLFTVDSLEEREIRADFSERIGVTRETAMLISGNKKELKQLVAQLLISFLSIMEDQKDKIDISYEEIRDNIFKLKESEKAGITDRLKSLTDEDRQLDTVLKINKLGVWGKGLKKGLTVYDKDMYEEEGEFRDQMEKAEREIRKRNRNVTSENVNQYLDDYLDEQHREEEDEREAYDMSYLNDDYEDGNFDGVEAPEEEHDDYADYDS